MGEILEFNLMNRDVVCTYVCVDFERDTILNKQFSKIVHLTVFGDNELTVPNLLKFFRSRCFEEGRPDKNLLLGELGLTDYNVIDIVKKTHGTLTCDDMWIRFKDEHYTYYDICKKHKPWRIV